MKKIGLIGGAGPEAGALLLKNIIQLYQEKGAWEDHHFPRIMLLSYNFSPMLESNKNENKIIGELQDAANILNDSKNEIVGIACNTLHSFVKSVNFQQLKFISIIDAVIDEIKNKSLKKILFLGTKTSVNAKIYETAASIDIIYPREDQQELIHDCIVQILKNKHSQVESTIISNIIDECSNNMHFDGIVLGCTELSVIHQNFAIQSLNQIIIFDPIYILAKN